MLIVVIMSNLLAGAPANQGCADIRTAKRVVRAQPSHHHSFNTELNDNAVIIVAVPSSRNLTISESL